MTEFAVCFEPWVGACYPKDSSGLFILGESHYGTDTARLTIDAIENHAIVRKHEPGPNGRRMRFGLFNNLNYILTGHSVTQSTESERRAVWNRISYANAVQALMTKPNQRPKKEDWITAQPAFEYYISSLKPDRVLILGIELRRHLSLPPSMNEKKILCIPHPSSRGFSASQWHKECKNFIGLN